MKATAQLTSRCATTREHSTATVEYSSTTTTARAKLKGLAYYLTKLCAGNPTSTLPTI